MTRRRGNRWQQRQRRDPYVKAAQRDGWRSRAAYKLEQIDAKEKLLKAGMLCVDLGAAPGSWSQYAASRLGEGGRVVAVDLLAMDPLPGVEVIQGDFEDPETLQVLLDALDDRKADLVMSDMAPNLSGNRAIDQPRSMRLAELALDLAGRCLGRNGSFLCKVFQGADFEAFLAEARRQFGQVRVVKPPASRSGSNEVYLVARNYRV